VSASDPKQAWKDALLDEIAPDVRTGRFVTTIVAPQLRDALLDKYDKNETGSYARDVVSDLLCAACASWVTSVKRAIPKQKVACVMPDGTVIRYDNQSARGFPERLKDGGILHQQKLWREMDEQQFLLMYRGVVALATAHSMVAAAFRKVVDAFQKYPHAKTVEEVCRLAKIDPHEIEIKIDDVRRLLG
jgi:hypothetical protein